jgi:hypothetical protein
MILSGDRKKECDRIAVVNNIIIDRLLRPDCCRGCWMAASADQLLVKAVICVLEMPGHPCVVDILRESICRPFVLSVKRREVEFVDRMAVVLMPFLANTR